MQFDPRKGYKPASKPVEQTAPQFKPRGEVVKSPPADAPEAILKKQSTGPNFITRLSYHDIEVHLNSGLILTGKVIGHNAYELLLETAPEECNLVFKGAIERIVCKKELVYKHQEA